MKKINLKGEKINNYLNNKLNNLIKKINCDQKESDMRGEYRALYNGKIIFRGKTQKDYNEKLKNIENSIKNMYKDKEIIGLMTSLDGNIYGIKNSINTYLDYKISFLLGKNFNKEGNYFISSKNLIRIFNKPNMIRKNYIINKEDINSITGISKTLMIEEILNLNNVNFSQDGYFEDIKNSYKAIFKNAIKHKNYDSIKSIKNIEIGKVNKNIYVMEGTHKILALNELFNEIKNNKLIFGEFDEEYLFGNFIELLEVINIKNVDFKIGNYKEKDLKKLDINSIDTIDESIVKHYLLNFHSKNLTNNKIEELRK